MLLAPLRLEFGWGEIAQRRMDPLVHVHVIQEATNLVIGIMIVEILGQVNLYFYSESTATLEYVTIEYAGSDAAVWFPAAVEIHSDNVTMENCTVRNNAGLGLSVNAGPTLANNTIFNNTGYPVYIPAAFVEGAQLTNNLFAGNLHDAVLIGNGSLDGAHTWPSWLADYEVHMSGSFWIQSSSSLTLPAGLALRFPSSTRLEMVGALVAQGTVSQPITFTANTTEPVAGFWQGLEFCNGGTGTLEYVTIEYAGYAGGFAAVEIHSDNVTMENCTVRNNAGLGLSVNAGPTLANNTIFNNTGYPVYIPAAFVEGAQLTNNLFAGNLHDAVLIGNGSLDGAHTWPSWLADYEVHMSGSFWIQSSSSLTLPAGLALRFPSSTRLEMVGALVAQGTVSQPITFTANTTEPVAGFWQGLEFCNGGTGTLEYVTIEYAGYAGGFAAVEIHSDNVTMENCTVRNNAGPGLYVYEVTTTITDSVIQSNGTAGILVERASVTVEGSTFSGNASYGIENVSLTPTVQAKNNWWGHSSGPYHPDTNPYGLGSRVSDGVAYDPWLVSRPGDLWSTALDLGQPVTGSVQSLEYAYYQLVITAGLSLVLEVTPLSGSETLWVYGELEEPPLWTHYDVRAEERTASGIYELLVAPTYSGTYYFAAYGRKVSGTGGDYRIVAQTVDRHLSAISPNTGGNAGEVTLKLSGLPFDGDMQVQLRSAALPTLAADAITVASSTALWAHFDLTGAATGVYDVYAIWPKGREASLTRAFTITQGAGPHLEAHLVAPDPVRPGREHVLWVEYANTGDADMIAPLLIVSTSPTATLKTVRRTTWLTGSLHLLGVNPESPAGILPPGTGGRIPVLFKAANQDVTFRLEALKATNALVDWEAYKETLRPEAIPPDQWETVWPALKAQLGTTWADYLRVLGENAERFRQRGEDYHCIRHLLALEIQEALGEPIATIAGRVLHAETRAPLLGVTVIARAKDGQTIRTAETDPRDGRFAATRLPNATYELIAEEYYLTPTVTVEITRNLDVTGLVLLASPIPNDPAPEASKVTYASPELLDVEGTPHLVFVRDGLIHHTTHDGSSWADAVPVPGAQGMDPKLLYSPMLLDDTAPGLVLFWRGGTGNEAAILYAAARQDGSGGWEWSEVEMVSDADVASDNPRAVVDADDDPLVVWQVVDRDQIEDDTDLYYDNASISSTALTWSSIDGVLVLDRPAVLEGGRVLPAGTAVALTQGGEAFVLAPDAPDWQATFNYGFEFEKKGNVPSYIPYIGGQNIVQFSASFKGTANESEASASGSIGGGASLMQDRVTGSVGRSLSARWALDKRTCRFNFDKATLSASLGITGKSPYHN